MPHSDFLGWSDNDQAKAMAVARLRAELCPKCHTARSDWLDDEGVPLDPPKLEPVVMRCHGCGELGRLDAHLREEKVDDPGAYMAFQAFDPGRTLVAGASE